MIDSARAVTGQSAGASEDRKNKHGPHIGLRTRASIKELIAESIGMAPKHWSLPESVSAELLKVAPWR
jgi:hypothetical protein